MKKVFLIAIMAIAMSMTVLATDYSYLKLNAVNGDLTELNPVDDITKIEFEPTGIKLSGYLYNTWYGRQYGGFELTMMKVTGRSFRWWQNIKLMTKKGTVEVEQENGKTIITAEGAYAINAPITINKPKTVCNTVLEEQCHMETRERCGTTQRCGTNYETGEEECHDVEICYPVEIEVCEDVPVEKCHTYNNREVIVTSYSGTLDEIKIEIENNKADITATKDGTTFAKVEGMDVTSLYVR